MNGFFRKSLVVGVAWLVTADLFAMPFRCPKQISNLVTTRRGLFRLALGAGAVAGVAALSSVFFNDREPRKEWVALLDLFEELPGFGNDPDLGASVGIDGRGVFSDELGERHFIWIRPEGPYLIPFSEFEHEQTPMGERLAIEFTGTDSDRFVIYLSRGILAPLEISSMSTHRSARPTKPLSKFRMKANDEPVAQRATMRALVMRLLTQRNRLRALGPWTPKPLVIPPEVGDHYAAFEDADSELREITTEMRRIERNLRRWETSENYKQYQAITQQRNQAQERMKNLMAQFVEPHRAYRRVATADGMFGGDTVDTKWGRQYLRRVVGECRTLDDSLLDIPLVLPGETQTARQVIDECLARLRD